jgi:hypothetical protein
MDDDHFFSPLLHELSVQSIPITATSPSNRLDGGRSQGPVKYRQSCDNCHRLKIKCGQEREACSRCRSYGEECVYGVSRRRGRARTRGRKEVPHPGAEKNADNLLRRTETMGNSASESSSWTISDTTNMVVTSLVDMDMTGSMGWGSGFLTRSSDDVDLVTDAEAYASLASGTFGAGMTPEESSSGIEFSEAVSAMNGSPGGHYVHPGVPLSQRGHSSTATASVNANRPSITANSKITTYQSGTQEMSSVHQPSPSPSSATPAAREAGENAPPRQCSHEAAILGKLVAVEAASRYCCPEAASPSATASNGGRSGRDHQDSPLPPPFSFERLLSLSRSALPSSATSWILTCESCLASSSTTLSMVLLLDKVLGLYAKFLESYHCVSASMTIPPRPERRPGGKDFIPSASTLAAISPPASSSASPTVTPLSNTPLSPPTSWLFSSPSRSSESSGRPRAATGIDPTPSQPFLFESYALSSTEQRAVVRLVLESRLGELRSDVARLLAHVAAAQFKVSSSQRPSANSHGSVNGESSFLVEPLSGTSDNGAVHEGARIATWRRPWLLEMDSNVYPQCEALVKNLQARLGALEARIEDVFCQRT